MARQRRALLGEVTRWVAGLGGRHEQRDVLGRAEGTGGVADVDLLALGRHRHAGEREEGDDGAGGAHDSDLGHSMTPSDDAQVALVVKVPATDDDAVILDGAPARRREAAALLPVVVAHERGAMGVHRGGFRRLERSTTPGWAALGAAERWMAFRRST